MCDSKQEPFNNSAWLNPFPGLMHRFFLFYRIVSEAFKERPRPRKPDYLRESFDLTKITMATNLPQRAPSTRVSTEGDDETKPRSSPPMPSHQTRSNIHPRQRTPWEESIVFPFSSGEESFHGPEGSRGTGKMPHVPLISVVYFFHFFIPRMRILMPSIF